MDDRESLVAGVRKINLHRTEDIRGSLSSIEFDDHIPFTPKRIFTIVAVPSAQVRGEHAHRICHQLVTCVTGSVSVLVDDGTRRDVVELKDPGVGLYLPPMIWSAQSGHSADAVVIVLASHAYDAHDYVRTYGAFLEIKQSTSAGTELMPHGA